MSKLQHILSAPVQCRPHKDERVMDPGWFPRRKAPGPSPRVWKNDPTFQWYLRAFPDRDADSAKRFAKACEERLFFSKQAGAKRTRVRREDSDEEQEEEEACMVCGGSDQPETILMCDKCPNECHLRCLNPPLDEVPKGAFVCQDCSATSTTSDEDDDEEEKTSAPTSNVLEGFTGVAMTTSGTEALSHAVHASVLAERTAAIPAAAPSDAMRMECDEELESEEPPKAKRQRLLLSPSVLSVSQVESLQARVEADYATLTRRTVEAQQGMRLATLLSDPSLQSCQVSTDGIDPEVVTVFCQAIEERGWRIKSEPQAIVLSK